MSSDVPPSPTRPPQPSPDRPPGSMDVLSDVQSVPGSSDTTPPTAPLAPADGITWRDWWRRQCSLREATGFLVSLVLHIVLLVTLSLLVWVMPQDRGLTLVVGRESEASPLLPNDQQATNIVSFDAPAEDGEPLDELVAPAVSTPASPEQVWLPPPPRTSVLGDYRNDPRSLILESHSLAGGGFAGRTPSRRGEMLAREGGTRQSEQAVALALKWLAAHQFADGGWRFAFETGPCQGRCRHPGTVGSSTGATGLALLPFLGAGFTHQQGTYRDVVHNGLYYLKSRMIKKPQGGDLQEGTMYAQGIAAIAFCEAFAMTGDETFKSTAQEAVDFICHAQHSKGGWRYLPRQPGDTTVTGWQMMALKSAHMAGLSVPSPTLSLVDRFLDSVQTGDGAFYGYTAPGKNPGTTAVGLLLRMYTGWKRDDPRLVQGVSYLAEHGPSRTDMYFNYYATQVLHHFGGDEWPEWNVPMREYLISQQAQHGHERGSWHFQDQHGTSGGRLYTTAMCAMILEVYYRHMPLYAARAVERGL